MQVRDLNSEDESKGLSIPISVYIRLTVIKFFRYLHTGYGLIIFALLFALFFPFLLIPIVFKKQFQLVGILNRWWARLLFLLVGLPFKVEYRFKREASAQYIFCPNHFSYLDIPTMGLNHHNTIFVGKSAMERIPLFGFMYGRLHITVDRSSLKSKYSMLLRALDAVDEGKSLVIYPEGGIMTNQPPHMAPFKEGAFRIAIEKQIPLVPVTIPFNWIILPDGDFLLRWHAIKVIFHEPIDTTGMTMKDIEVLKKKVAEVINGELIKYKENEN